VDPATAGFRGRERATRLELLRRVVSNLGPEAGEDGARGP
jgi:hypothetical protein